MARQADDIPHRRPDTSPEDGREHTDFGFSTVPVDEKTRLVGKVFDSVSGRYDLMNDLMSAGVHRLWKDAMIDWLAPRPGQPLLDLAGGTGDIARRYHDRGGGPVLVCDINPSMMEAGRARGAPGIRWLCGDAEQLPLADRSIEVCTMAFGLRNTTRIDAVLREIRRVLAIGGRFLCLEFSRPVLEVLRRPYDLYSMRIIPEIGHRVTGDREAYRYLVESIRRFPDQEALAERMRSAGLDRVCWRSLSGGIVALHSGWRL